jgi:steroid 5-alpha reductase family enzyme
MSSWFVVSLIRARNDVADVAWGLGFVLMSWLSLLLAEAVTVVGLLITGLVSVWGARLALHVHRRNKGKAEDFRYLAWRNEWGKWFLIRSYFQVYILQGVFLFLVVLPVIMINLAALNTFSVLGVVGIAVWAVGFYFEFMGDAQLSNFLRDPNNKGSLLRTGLWRYTRHPNYFGEVTQWWGVWLVALSTPLGIIGIISPITITILILFVSGIPMLEKKMSLHPDFAEYARTTNSFFPFFPKK